MIFIRRVDCVSDRGALQNKCDENDHRYFFTLWFVASAPGRWNQLKHRNAACLAAYHTCSLIEGESLKMTRL